MCSTGKSHTICLSDEGIVYSFGRNKYGQLGLRNFEVAVITPSPILNLPKITQVSCGKFFTVCLAEEGTLWSFGYNDYGQLGTGNRNYFNVPQKMQDIPLAKSIYCGGFHVLIITDDLNLWGVGDNQFGQLCLNNKEISLKPRQTLFTNIIKIAAGSFHSIFQNKEQEIYGCGENSHGQLGLGHNQKIQIEPCKLLRQPPNIVQFCCGSMYSIFLDSEGNVFLVGYNNHYCSQFVLHKIENFTPIRTISAGDSVNYLLDFDGYVWSFGDRNRTNTIPPLPSKIPSLKDIKQISNGCSSCHFLAKDSRNKIFVMGDNSSGQLGTDKIIEPNTPIEFSSDFEYIWGEQTTSNRAKSARK